MVHQTSLLYGLPVVRDRLVPYHRVDPAAARSMFIRHALIGGDWNRHHTFIEHNEAMLADAAAVEDKVRRRGVLVDEDALYDFYDARLPDTVTTARHFDSWWKKKRREDENYLDFDPRELVDADVDASDTDFPDVWRQGSIDYALRYAFEPGDPFDGVTVEVPVPLLAGIDPAGFDWLVPGLREELVTELIRTLPKALRRAVVPAPDFARLALPKLTPRSRPITEDLAEALRDVGAAGIDAADFLSLIHI